MLVDGWAEKGSGPRSQLPQPAWAQVPRDKLALHHALRERGCAEPVNTRLPTPIAPPHLAAEPGAGAKTRRRRTGRCRTGGWREDPAEKDWPVTLTLPTSSKLPPSSTQPTSRGRWLQCRLTLPPKGTQPRRDKLALHHALRERGCAGPTCCASGVMTTSPTPRSRSRSRVRPAGWRRSAGALLVANAWRLRRRRVSQTRRRGQIAGPRSN